MRKYPKNHGQVGSLLCVIGGTAAAKKKNTAWRARGCEAEWYVFFLTDAGGNGQTVKTWPFHFQEKGRAEF